MSQAQEEVVVWLTEGGVVEYVSTNHVNVTVLDMQNILAGDSVPKLTQAQRKLMPDALLDQLEAIEADRNVG